VYFTKKLGNLKLCYNIIIVECLTWFRGEIGVLSNVVR